jgi:hypothetical protein
MTFWWFKEKRIRKKLQITAYHKISTLLGITSGDGCLGLEFSPPCNTVVKSGVVRMEWSQETKQDALEEFATEMKRPVDECRILFALRHGMLRSVTGWQPVQNNEHTLVRYDV